MSFDATGTKGRGMLIVIAFLLLLPAGPAFTQIGSAEYAGRREALTRTLGDGIYYFEADVASNGRQDPDFNYLTGVTSSPARLLMVRQGDESDAFLFLPGEPEERPGVYPLSGFEQVAREALSSRPANLITSILPTGNEIVSDLLEQMSMFVSRAPQGSGRSGLRLIDPSGTLRTMRGTKSPAETGLLQIASDITRNAHIAAMRTAEVGMNEFELQAVIEYTFMRNGAARPGFDSIIGSGPNSTILHWSDNNRFMEEGDVIVMDIGAEYFGYTSDVTRTIPVSGTFTREQREIYEIVLAAHLAAAELAEVEGTPYSDLSATANEVLAAGLARIGLIESPDATLPADGRGRVRNQLGLFYYHGLGHGIGLVVHDSMPDRNMIVEGACFTIEPGIYVRPEVLDMLGTGSEAEELRRRLAPVVARYADIGIRIEDSYAFTDRGLIRLSAGTPRTVEEIEAMMAMPNLFNESRDAGIVEKFRNFIPPGNFQ